MSHDRIGIERNARFRAAAASSPRRRTSAGPTSTGAERRGRGATIEGFWAQLAREHLLWHKPFTKALDESNAPFYKWFDDGELNVSYNCLDRNLENGNADKIAIIFEADDGAVTKVTYQRAAITASAASPTALKSLGIKKGDRVIIYMPMSIEGVVAMQACARIGATHSVVFGGFSAKSLQERIIDAGAVAVITADEQMRGGKQLPLKAIVDEALGDGRLRGGAQRHRLQAHRRRRRRSRRRATCGCTSSSRGSRTPASRNGSAPSIRCSSSTRRARPASPRACSTATGGYLLWAALTMKLDVRHQADGRLLVHRRHRLGHRPHLHRLRTARGRRDRGRVRGRADLSRRRPLLADDRQAQGDDLLHRADGDPLADQGVGRRRRDGAEELRPVDACACSAPSASRSIRKPGCGTTRTSAASAARSSTRGGRPKPAAT